MLTLSLSPPTPLACSLWGNNIRDKGASAIAAVLKETIISELECAATRWCLLLCQRPLTLLHCCFPASRLGGNLIGGYYDDENDKFVATTEGIIALCEGLKGSSVSLLECAAIPKLSLFVSVPIDTRFPCLQFGQQQPHRLWPRHVRPAQARGSPSVYQD